jgi:hypothetical protein
MVGFVGVIAFFIVLGLSLIITRVATIGLTLTGLSHEAARFQARSAFTGTGFTTSEAEKVVDHPVRRRIIMVLMVARSAGLLSIILSLILSFADTGPDADRLTRLLWLASGVGALWLLVRLRPLDRWLGRLIEWCLKRWTDLDARDYASLLKLAGEYNVTELHVPEESWLAGKRLRECRLMEEGITVLGIYRDDGDYVGVPRKETKVYPGDILILYGRTKALNDLDRRRADLIGEQAHERAVGEQKEAEAEQDHREGEHEREREVSQAGGA